jgi:hypothetical protein
MAIGNGKATNGTTLPEAVEEHGGYWSGAGILRAHLDLLAHNQRSQIEAARGAAWLQIGIMQATAEGDKAEADLEAALRSSDYKAAAEASRRLAFWEARRVLLLPGGG